MICHSKETASSYVDEDGNAIPCVQPDLTRNIYAVASGITDLIGYIGVEFDKDGNSHRYLYTRQTPTIFAGSRWKYLNPKIEFGYNELVQAIGEAIEKQKELDGATVVDKTEMVVEERRPFTDVMDEAKNIWVSYVGGVEDEEEKENRLRVINDIIQRVFGKPIKLSQATPSQQDLVELFINTCHDELKL